MPQPTTGQVQDYATTVANQQGLNPSVFLSLLNQESGFNTNARGSSGEIGVGQLLPGTAQQMGVDPNDWQQNILGSARYLSSLLNLSGGNYSAALAGYNAGPRVASGQKAVPSSTKDYVSSILGNLGKFGGDFKDFLGESPMGMTGSVLNTIKPGSGDVFHGVSDFFTLKNGIRITVVVIGVILIGASVVALLSGTKFVKGVVNTASAAAIAA